MPSISLSPCEGNDYKADFNEFVKEINDLYVDINSDEGLSLGDVEVRVSEAFCSFKQKFLEMCVSKKSNKKEREPVECPACQELCRPLRMRARYFTTLCGKTSVNRWVYCCEQGHRHAPWEVKQKLLGQYTRRVAEAMCRLSALLDYRAAAKALAFQGIEVSHTIVREKVLEWSSDLSVSAQVEPQILAANQRWYVSCDGCYTNSTDGWKETKVGCVYRDYPQCGSDAVSSARETSIRYVATRNDAAHFGKELYALATNSGIYQEAIDTQEIVFLGDGAAWIWNLADEYFPNAVEIVDYKHAKSHLSDVAKVAFGETETEAIQDWVKTTEPILYDGNITEVAARIRGLGTQHPEVSDIFEREARYFEKHAARPRYKKFREKGYQIGSGVIESACPHVVGQRCPQAAMRWKEKGINPVLALRCLVKNGDWDKYWNELPQAA